MAKNPLCKKCKNELLKSIFWKKGQGKREWVKIQKKLYCPNCDKIS